MHTANTPTQPTATDLVRRLHDEDDGAQAMEYAALAGGGATMVGILIALLQSDAVQERIADFVTGLFDSLAGNLGNLL